jgi:hypothetical protein
MSLSPGKANSIIVIDPNAVLTCPVAAQRLQPVPRRNAEIAEYASAVQCRQPLVCNERDRVELLYPLSLKQLLGLFTTKRSNQAE